MSNEVDQIYKLLGEAKKIAREIQSQNLRNAQALITRDEQALAEVRPLSIDERLLEANKYHKFFSDLYDILTSAEEAITMNY